MITNHTQLLNALIEKYNLRSYLEIGVQTPAQNFDKVNAVTKIGIDPELFGLQGKSIYQKTSDEWFGEKVFNAKTDDYEQVNTTFDLVFIDGLHTADQVKRDFENSMRCLSDNGFILIHDTLPDEEQYTTVPRETRRWYGNVFVWAMTLNQYDGIGFVTFNIDCGCTLVWKMPEKKAAPKLTDEMNWETYKSIGNVLLNVVNEVVI